MKKREFTISFFLHVWEKKAEEISLEEFHNDLRGARWKVLAESYRRWMQTGMAEEAKKLKGALNAVVVAGRCRGGHAANQVSRLSGLALFDFDHCPEKLSGMKEKAKALPYVVEAFVSISGEGLKLIVRIDAENAGQYAAAYPVVARELERVLGHPCDMSCRDLGRACYASYDPDAYYNPAAGVFPWREQADGLPRKGECAWAMPEYTCSDEDFHTAMLMTDVLLEHSLLLSTCMRKSESKPKPLKPYFRLRPVLQSLSGTFTFTQVVDKAVEMGIPKTTAKRLFRKTVELKLVVKEGDAYRRTTRSWGAGIP